jgi:hypothetical protein
LFVLPVSREDKPAKGAITVLLPVQVGDVWRVQIIWPNGSVHYFGRFAAKKAAVDWIAAHAWLMARPRLPDDAFG